MSVTITPLSARVDVACLAGAMSVVPVSPDGSVAVGVQGAAVRIAAVPSGVQVVPVVSTPRVTLFSVGYPGPPGPQGPPGSGSGTGTDLSYTAATRLLESSTGTDVTLPLVASGAAGLAPASGGGTSNFLRADGTWAAPPGGGGGGGNSYFPSGW